MVVIEAAQRSGSLITARFALEQGREVFAVPGSPLDPRAEGANALLKQGATLVTGAADVIAVIEPILGRPLAPPDVRPGLADQPPATPQPDGDLRHRVLTLLGPTPVALDELVRLAGCPPSDLRVILLELELAGRLARHGGSLVSLA